MTLDVIQPESSLHLRVGDGAVMVEQLRTVVELSQLPNVTVRVTTYDAGQYEAWRLGDFATMERPWGNPRVHVEGCGGGRFVADADDVAYFAAAFDHACRIALSPNESREFIQELAEAWSVR